MKTIIVSFGGDSVPRSVEDDANIGSIVGDGNVKAQLGYGDNVRVLVNGVEQPSTAIPSNGTKLVVETRTNSKANHWRLSLSLSLHRG